MSDRTYKPGDRVCLLSGGPVMVVQMVAQVNEYDVTPVYVCVWIDERGVPQQAGYRAVVLRGGAP